jgi:hypothetical protein
MKEEKRDRAASDRAARWLLLIHQLPPKPAYPNVLAEARERPLVRRRGPGRSSEDRKDENHDGAR